MNCLLKVSFDLIGFRGLYSGQAVKCLGLSRIFAADVTDPADRNASRQADDQ
jgi:hypothetical protein